MNLVTLSAEIVELIHHDVINSGELEGRALDKSLEDALALVDNRLAYGLVEDIFDLVAHTAEAIAQGHCFNDGNKRTAFSSLYAGLGLNGLEPDFETEVIADKIIFLAQSKLSAEDLAAWLRDQ